VKRAGGLPNMGCERAPDPDGDGISKVEGRRTTLSWLYRRPSDPGGDGISNQAEGRTIPPGEVYG
jgi:hypothetical protein